MGALIDLMQWAVIVFIIIIGMRMTHRMGRLESRGPIVRYHQLPSLSEDPKPICGCDHHQCFHDESGCGAQGRNDYTPPCGCKRYTGPEALPTVLP